MLQALYISFSFGQPSLHIAENCIQFFPIVIYLQKNSIYLESFSRIIERLKEAGIIDKYLTDVLSESKKKSEIKFESNSLKRLSSSELQVRMIV